MKLAQKEESGDGLVISWENLNLQEKSCTVVKLARYQKDRKAQKYLEEGDSVWIAINEENLVRN